MLSLSEITLSVNRLETWIILYQCSMNQTLCVHPPYVTQPFQTSVINRKDIIHPETTISLIEKHHFVKTTMFKSKFTYAFHTLISEITVLYTKTDLTRALYAIPLACNLPYMRPHNWRTSANSQLVFTICVKVWSALLADWQNVVNKIIEVSHRFIDCTTETNNAKRIIPIL